MTKKKTKNTAYIEEIRTKYKQLDEKMKFIAMLSEATGLNIFTVKNHHFTKFDIPIKYRVPYLKLLDKTLKGQEV